MAPISVFAAGKTSLITGGASGVGLAVAQLCRKHGMRVSIADNNAEYLAKAKETLGSKDVETYEIDASKLDQWASLKAKVGKVDFLMLNAGIGLKGSWGDSDYFHKARRLFLDSRFFRNYIFDTNFFGVVNGLNTFVPVLQSQDEPSTIVITGSKQGITNPPGNVAYNASKSAVKTIAEHLNFDLKDTKTSVHLLVPGWTFTGLSGNTPGSNKEKPAGAWAAEQVADYLYKKMEQEKFYIICPDNDVTEETDKKRMMWSVGDIINERQPLSRWRKEYKDEAAKWMDQQKL
ncbi:NAD(P)-binding protein [Tothia fuscella]|uniref:NAD(P)-binding protein n=1 Tax=Tothia fuscella TaxID=1048955 RepID=A0A9P4NZ58_9PEZI|nr:NAD(P)-binding protein [Tothia fuscella]